VRHLVDKVADKTARAIMACLPVRRRTNVRRVTSQLTACASRIFPDKSPLTKKGIVMKLFVYALALSLGAMTVAAGSATAATLTLASTYDAAGTNPDGSHYTGTATVEIISDTTFTIQWTIAGEVYKGFGMRMNDALSATYTIDGEPGLVIYKVGANGAFDGLWAIRGKNGNGTERLTPR
jgi:hypothetical protein